MHLEALLDNLVPLIVIGLSQCCLTAAAKPPSYIHPCEEMTDQCLKSAIQEAIPHFAEGIPEVEVKPLDPFYVKHVETVLPGGLKVTFDNGRTTGFKKCIVDNAHANVERGSWEVSFHCNLTVRGQYKAEGKLLGFGIRGDGDAKIRMTNLRMTIKLQADYVKREDGDVYVDFKDYKYTYKYGDSVHYNLTNMFPGNAQLNNQLLHLMNMNSIAVAEEFGTPLVKTSVDNVLNNIKNFFEHVPYNEIIKMPLGN